MANTDKELSASIYTSALVLHGTEKKLSIGAKAGTTILHAVGKQLSTNANASPSILHEIGKKVKASATAGPAVNKNVSKKISTSVRLLAIKEINDATLTMVYNGNAELGLGAQEGAQFNIIATGTFTAFSISINEKTLTYTENCVDQTITIDNVNATVKNGTTNKLSKVTGDVADFLKLIPGDNVITYTKTGPNVDFTFDFSPIFI